MKYDLEQIKSIMKYGCHLPEHYVSCVHCCLPELCGYMCSKAKPSAIKAYNMLQIDEIEELLND